MTIESNLEPFDAMRRGGRPIDEILTAMKRHGLTIVQAIKGSIHLFGFSLAEAKRAVISHPAWHDEVMANEPLHNDLLRIFDDES